MKFLLATLVGISLSMQGRFLPVITKQPVPGSQIVEAGERDGASEEASLHFSLRLFSPRSAGTIPNRLLSERLQQASLITLHFMVVS